VGGSFGATCGLLLMKLLPTWHIQPGIYAMCAATAMLGGVFRASISLVIIVVEGTQVPRCPPPRASAVLHLVGGGRQYEQLLCLARRHCLPAHQVPCRNPLPLRLHPHSRQAHVR